MRTVSRSARRVFLGGATRRARGHAVPHHVKTSAAREAARNVGCTSGVIIRKPLEFSRPSPNANWWRECRLAVNIAICEVVCDTPRPFSVLTETGERAAIQPYIYL